MIRLLRLTAACACLAVLAGCASYQFGDVSRELLARQQSYCAMADPEARAVLLTLIRLKVPGYPASGLCSDAEQALARELAQAAAHLPDGATIDIEQARKDQARFQE